MALTGALAAGALLGWMTLRVRAHDKLKLALKPERLHLFDAETEAAI